MGTGTVGPATCSRWEAAGVTAVTTMTADLLIIDRGHLQTPLQSLFQLPRLSPLSWITSNNCYIVSGVVVQNETELFPPAPSFRPEPNKSSFVNLKHVQALGFHFSAKRGDAGPEIFVPLPKHIVCISALFIQRSLDTTERIKNN